MRASTRTGRAVGLYAAIALIAYALLGDVLDDLYLPGRRGRGLHLHNEAIPPAVVALCLLAAKCLVDAVGPIRHEQRVQRTLTVLAVLALGWTMAIVAFPPGKALATETQCRATFVRIDALLADAGGDAALSGMLRERATACPQQPVLAHYARCVAEARVPTDLNACDREATWRFERDVSHRVR